MSERRKGRGSRGQRVPAEPRRPPEDPGILETLRRRAGRNPGVTIAVLIAVPLLLSLLTFQPQPHTGGDNAAYIALGQSLLERGDYSSVYDPATPPHTQYPPVFPGILAGAMALGLEPWVQLKLIIALFSAGAVGTCYLWIRRRRRPMLALGVTLIMAASPGVLDLSHWILSDVPFWFFTVLALWAFERMRPELRARFAVAVAATVLAWFTRSAGLPLLLAAFGWLALRRRWKQLGVLAAVALPLALAWWLRARAQGGVDYVSQFWFVNPYAPELGRIGVADLAARVGENASKYLRIHLPILLTGTVGVLPLLASLLVTGLAAFGWVKRLRRPAVAELFLPLYLGLLLVWPAVWSGERFLLPALPLLLCYAGDGLVRLARLWKPAAVLAVTAPAVALIMLLGLPTGVASMRASGRCMLEYRTGDRYPCLPPVWREFFSVAEWTRAALPEHVVILSRKPRLFYAVAGLRGRVYPFTDRPADLLQAAAEAGARYVIVDGLDAQSQRYLIPALLRRPQAFCMMHAAPGGTSVLGILDGAIGLPDRTDPGADVTIPICDGGYWRPGAQPPRAAAPVPADSARPDTAVADTLQRAR